jgi:tetratricopeptide (TPR) repeat protein
MLLARALESKWSSLLCRSAGRTALAIEYFEKALALQPNLWSAYENMCQLGADVDPGKFFQVAMTRRTLQTSSLSSKASSYLIL